MRLCRRGVREVPLSQSPESDQAGRDTKELERQVAQQEALVLRMITQGTPTQADEDRLRQLQQKLTQMKERIRFQEQ